LLLTVHADLLCKAQTERLATAFLASGISPSTTAFCYSAGEQDCVVSSALEDDTFILFS